MALTELEPMSKPTRFFLPMLLLNIAYLFLRTWCDRLRWSRLRRARTRRTLWCAARAAWVWGELAAAGFISVRAPVRASTGVESALLYVQKGWKLGSRRRMRS